MSLVDDVRYELCEMLQEYVNESPTLGFCRNCPLMRYHADINYWECPYGNAVDSCEYNPQIEINRYSEALAQAFVDAMPE